ncbi:MAG: hypothetical protein A2X45_22630 [Lentisphaerae bacterium GWF2_50_93]|nr:MAG: hypothetical protein A2X45_22630 [Lentisphaerae bacterium GWF2_50_93]
MKIAMLSGCLAAAILAGTAVSAQETPKAKAQVIILKLDDMCTNGAPSNGSKAVSPRWQKVIDFVQAKKIKATIGVMGNSLEADNQKYFDYLKDLDKKGFELWNHGYMNRKATDPKGEFEVDSVEDQKTSLEKTQKLMKDKTGIELKAFGPHWSATNEATFQALEQIPEIKMVFFYAPPSKKTSKFIFERSVNLEVAVGNPDFDKFKEAYEKIGTRKEYIAMQGHPNMWTTDVKWNGFEKIMNYLIDKGCVFMTASEYLATVTK